MRIAFLEACSIAMEHNWNCFSLVALFFSVQGGPSILGHLASEQSKIVPTVTQIQSTAPVQHPKIHAAKQPSIVMANKTESGWILL